MDLTGHLAECKEANLTLTSASTPERVDLVKKALE